MASNGTQVFVLGGLSSAGAQADKIPLIHVLHPGGYSLLSFHLNSLQFGKRRAH
jgi:hypothetical protein